MTNPCPVCNKNEANYDKTYGVLPCNECRNRHRSTRDKELGANWPEFVPEKIREERGKYVVDCLQPYRNGELSREFVEAFPNKVRGLDPQVVKKAKYVWDEPAIRRLRKS